MEVPVRKYIMLLIFSGLMMLIHVFLFTKISVDLFKYAHYELEVVIAVLIMIFLSGNIFLWLYKGIEQVSFAEDSMIVVKTNGFLKIKRRFKLEHIEHIVPKKYMNLNESLIDEVLVEKLDKRNALLFWNNMGKIEIKYRGKYFTILNGLEKKNVIPTVNLLKLEVDRRCGKLGIV